MRTTPCELGACTNRSVPTTMPTCEAGLLPVSKKTRSPGLNASGLTRRSGMELRRHGARHGNPLAREHVPDEPAAVETVRVAAAVAIAARPEAGGRLRPTLCWQPRVARSDWPRLEIRPLRDQAPGTASARLRKRRRPRQRGTPAARRAKGNARACTSRVSAGRRPAAKPVFGCGPKPLQTRILRARSVDSPGGDRAK